jgi:hypothetical protein
MQIKKTEIAIFFAIARAYAQTSPYSLTRGVSVRGSFRRSYGVA